MAINGEKVETVTDFILLGAKIIADTDCSHKIKRCLFLGRIAMTNLESRDVTLPTKVCIVKALLLIYYLVLSQLSFQGASII